MLASVLLEDKRKRIPRLPGVADVGTGMLTLTMALEVPVGILTTVIFSSTSPKMPLLLKSTHTCKKAVEPLAFVTVTGRV